MYENVDIDIDDNLAVKLLRCLSSERAENYEDWIKICILFKNNFPGCYEEFDIWSRVSRKYDAKQNKKIWKSIKQKNGGLKVGSLMHWAQQDNKKEFNKIIHDLKVKEREEKQREREEKHKEHEARQREREEKRKEKTLYKNLLKQQEETANDDLQDWYTHKKVSVQREWFKLNYPLKYCCYRNGEINMYSAPDAKEYFKNVNLVQNINGKERTTYFFDMWTKDEFIRTYDEIVFDPTNNNYKCFNTFTGFEMYNEEIHPENIPEFDMMIKHIFNNEENINYFYSWLNHIITKPHIKTGVAIILYSDMHGVGKNTIIELILKLIGSKYCSMLNRIEDIQANFNAHLTQKLFIYGDEIKPRASDLASELKNIITKTEVLHQAKFCDSIKMKDLSNYMFTTNEEVAFKIEKNNRRFFCVEVDGKKPKEFYDQFYQSLNDNEKVSKFFSYVFNYPNLVDLKNIPETSYTQKLKEFSMNAIEHYLYNKIKNYSGDKINTKQFTDNIRDYAKENRLPSNISSIYIKTIMEKVGILRKRFNDNTKYIFPNLNEMKELLKKYNKGYYESSELDDIGSDSDDEDHTTKIFDV
jgi:hypothetical protein